MRGGASSIITFHCYCSLQHHLITIFVSELNGYHEYDYGHHTFFPVVESEMHFIFRSISISNTFTW